MKISIQMHSEPILSTLKELGQDRQGPFVLAKSLNMLAKRVQENLRDDFQASLQLRRVGWVKNQVKIDSGQWSTKTRLKVTIYLTDPASFIGDMEDGTQRVPILGRKYLAIPNKKVFGKGVIGPENELRVKNLNLHSTPFGTQGLLRTFILKDKETGTPLIMQRVSKDTTGKGKRGRNRKTGLRLLYDLVKHSSRPKKIHWSNVAYNTVDIESYGIFTDVMYQALRDTKKS